MSQSKSKLRYHIKMHHRVRKPKDKKYVPRSHSTTLKTQRSVVAHPMETLIPEFTRHRAFFLKQQSL